MRPFSRLMILGFLLLAVPSSLLAEGRAVRSTQSAASFSQLVRVLGDWWPTWITGGVIKPGAMRQLAGAGYGRDLAKAGSSMDPNGVATTPPVLPPAVPRPV